MSRAGAALGFISCLVLGTLIGYFVADTYANLKPRPVMPMIPQVVVENKIIVHESDQCIDSIDCMLLAEAVYHEARGEPIQGQIAVAYVILNRMESIHFPDTIYTVINQRCNFSYTCDGSLQKGIRDLKSFQRALKVANDVINGVYSDPTGGADHYYNPYKVNPQWSDAYVEVASIGRHVFHKRG